MLELKSMHAMGLSILLVYQVHSALFISALYTRTGHKKASWLAVSNRNGAKNQIYEINDFSLYI